ncbi:hypothetical protein LVJ94_50500 [Pendulispora rubella]|uniref:Tetratricopeptide repeat protein n=1 Tax=Pendulispora rubella TaxID=2741070 RepID=A0ABZ2L6C9_9BACT
MTGLAHVYAAKGDTAKALETTDDYLRHDPSLGLAWVEKGIALHNLDDVDGARDSFKECVRLSAYADRCLERLMILEGALGRCTDAERYARTLMSFPSTRRWWAVRLAGAILGRGGSIESAREAVKHLGAKSPIEPENGTRFHVLEGALSEAERGFDEMARASVNAKYEDVHASIAEPSFNLAMELGELPHAVRMASEYLAKREAWIPVPTVEGEMLALRVQYLAGGLSREAFAKRREDWLGGQGKTLEMSTDKMYVWTVAYAQASKTPEDAQDALRALPRFGTLGANVGGVAAPNAIGHMYSLAGDDERALPYLRDATAACDIVDNPFEHTWAHLHLGTALERTGDTPGACTAYGVVLKRWGKEPRSVSANAARARYRALRCSTTLP